MTIKFTIMGCGSSFGVPRADGNWENAILTKKKTIELDVRPCSQQ